MLQNPRSKLAAWSKYGDNSMNSAQKWDRFGSISVSKSVNISRSLFRFVLEPYSKWIELSKNGCVHTEDVRNNRSMGGSLPKSVRKRRHLHFEGDFGRHFISFPDFFYDRICFCIEIPFQKCAGCQTSCEQQKSYGKNPTRGNFVWKLVCP